MFKNIFTFFFILVFHIAVWAVGGGDTCSNGTKPIGTNRYNGVMEFCGGSLWQMMDTSFDTGTTCTPAGRQRFNAGAMQFCDGTYWHSMDGGTTTTQCVVAGAQIVTRSHTQLYCDGSSWHGMNSSGLAPTVTCWDIMSSNHCLPANGCSWNNGGCSDPSDCATRLDAPSCGVNPNCSWNAGACASNI